MAEQFILALDQGTTSSRAILFDRAGRPQAMAQQEFPQLLPAPGHVEHDPTAIWQSQLAVAKQVIERTKIEPRQVAAIGIANQRETTLLWERATGKPVCNAIVWQSRISAPICEQLKSQGLEATFRDKTGLVLDPYFSGTKITYLLDRDPVLRRRAEAGELAFGTVDSWLLWQLSGGKLHVTDVSNASRTLLLNLHTLAWDDELLRLLRVPRALLPEVRASSEFYGVTERSLFGAEIPLAGCAGDQQAATFGQACFELGMAKNTYGTGCFLLMNTGDKPVASRHQLLTTVGWRVSGKTTYCLEGAVFIAGAAVQWLRDGLGLIASAAEIEPLARSVSSSDGVLLVPAFVGLGAPYWDPYARGTMLGITRGTTAAHLARAVLESIAYQTCDLTRAMAGDAGAALGTLRVDGGASMNDLLMQIQADMLGTAVQRPVVAETTALGAAYLAGLAVGYWSSQREIAANWAVAREFQPTIDEPQRASRYRTWLRAVERSRGWIEPTQD